MLLRAPLGSRILNGVFLLGAEVVVVGVATDSAADGPGATILLGITGIALIVLLVRLLRSGVLVDRGEVVIRGVLVTRRIPMADIERVDIGPPSWYAAWRVTGVTVRLKLRGRPVALPLNGVLRDDTPEGRSTVHDLRRALLRSKDP